MHAFTIPTSRVVLFLILLPATLAGLMLAAPAAKAIDGNLATTEADCRWCHGNTSDQHHFLLSIPSDYSGRTYGCQECHPVVLDPVSNTYYTQLERDCIACHGSDVVVTGDRHHLLMYYPSSYTGIIYECLDCHQTVPDETGTINIVLKQTSSSPTTEPVSNLPPVADPGPDQAVNLGQPTIFSAAGSSDPDGVIESYSWDFGDGGSGVGMSTTHTYAAPGQYSATLTVTDDRGATSSGTACISVGVPPQVFSDEALSIAGLKRYEDPDDKGDKQDATLDFSNGKKQFAVANTSGSYSVVTMRTGIESGFVSHAVLNLQVTGLVVNLPQTLRVYAYLSDGKTPNSAYYVSRRITATGAANLDVTSLIGRMKGYGWMKFRIVCVSKGLTISNGSFLLE